MLHVEVFENQVNRVAADYFQELFFRFVLSGFPNRLDIFYVSNEPIPTPNIRTISYGYISTTSSNGRIFTGQSLCVGLVENLEPTFTRFYNAP